MFEWFNPLFLQDQANKYQTQDFVRVSPNIVQLNLP